jgi:SAM-dependent methyltransferase
MKSCPPMRHQAVLRLLNPLGSLVARQLGHPRGWLGRLVVLRVLNRGNRELIEGTLGLLELTPDSRLLDVGFGGGLSLELAAERGVRRLAGVDPSEAAVAHLSARPPAWLGAAELTIKRGVVQALPWEDAAFDAVMSINTLYFWPELEPAFCELRRVLRPGGQLALGFSSTAKLKSFGAITRHGFTFHDRGELLAEAERVGFADLRWVDLKGRVTEGDSVLLGSVLARGRA